MTCKHIFLLLLFATISSAPAAFADTVSLTLLNPVQSGSAGTVFTYVATVSAPLSNGGPEYLTGDSITTFGGPFTADDSDFINNFPLFLNPGDSFTGDLFTMMATAGSAGTATMGTFVLQGGSNPGDQFQLASANFAATATATATPEPSGLLLLATGTVGVLAIGRRRGRTVTAI